MLFHHAVTQRLTAIRKPRTTRYFFARLMPLNMLWFTVEQ